MAESVYKVLFLSRRGSARALMAEAIVKRLGKGRFQAFSAAVEPAERPEPDAIEVLKQAGYEVEGLAPAHWRRFSGDNAPPLDFVFTLSDTAAGEQLPDWSGGPVTAHWRYPDPVLAEGDTWEKRQAYGRLLSGLERHLRTFMELPMGTLDRMSLTQHVKDLGAQRSQ
jgi:arsenate reductase (thioredoxin)